MCAARALTATMIASLVLAGCGGDDAPPGAERTDQQVTDDLSLDDTGLQQFGDPLAGGDGGGGTLDFDGEQIVFDGAVCMLDGEQFDIGTISADSFRVFLSWTNPQNPVSIQILDGDGLQWFPDGEGSYERDGGVFTSPLQPYFNNSDDRKVEAGFTIECP